MSNAKKQISESQKFINALIQQLAAEARKSDSDIFEQIRYIEDYSFEPSLLSELQKEQVRLDILRILITTMEE